MAINPKITVVIRKPYQQQYFGKIIKLETWESYCMLFMNQKNHQIVLLDMLIAS